MTTLVCRTKETTQIQFSLKENENKDKSIFEKIGHFFKSHDGHLYAKKVLAMPHEMGRTFSWLRTPGGELLKEGSRGFDTVGTLVGGVSNLAELPKAFATACKGGGLYPRVKVLDAVIKTVDAVESGCSIPVIFEPLAPSQSLFARSCAGLRASSQGLSLFSDALSLSYNITQLRELSQLEVLEPVDLEDDVVTWGEKALAAAKRQYAIKIAKGVMTVFAAAIALVLVFALCWLSPPLILGLAASALAVKLFSLTIMTPLEKYYAYTEDYKLIDVSDAKTHSI